MSPEAPHRCEGCRPGAAWAPYGQGPISPRAKWGPRLQDGAWIPHTGVDRSVQKRQESPGHGSQTSRRGALPSPLHPVLTPKGVALAGQWGLLPDVAVSGKGQACVTDGSCPARWEPWGAGGRTWGLRGQEGLGGWPWRTDAQTLPPLCIFVRRAPPPPRAPHALTTQLSRPCHGDAIDRHPAFVSRPAYRALGSTTRQLCRVSKCVSVHVCTVCVHIWV